MIDRPRPGDDRDPPTWIGRRKMRRPTSATPRGSSACHLDDAAVAVLALRTVLADVPHKRSVGDRVEDGVLAAGVHVAPPQEVWHHYDVVGLPLEAMAADLGVALAIHH